MRYNYDIYIKGKGWKNKASCAIFVVEDGVEIFKGGKSFTDFIPTKAENIPLIPYKTQYQMEMYAFAWALSKCQEESDVTFYTNNMVFKKWIEELEVPSWYANIFSYCINFMKGKNIGIKHVKKGSECFTKEVDDIADRFLPDSRINKF